ncbi:uncharacterized protein DUF4474 [Serpentinicella alkaliphila]|uniref:Uncharacterized protein DUF4474 n=1 Tax=Serpentinicella alkaliphila TaxID=1734049 RepID=A0A4R2TEL3_9FIRM|nr:uncharacterized protein DUF4474 [Serpentinicella alkaliphila]
MINSKQLDTQNLLIFLLYILIPIVILYIHISIKKNLPNLYLIVYQWFSYITVLLKNKLSRFKIKNKQKDDLIVEIMESTGYSYEIDQDIFYSNLYAWQRNMGYCRLYDKAAAPLSMTIDCEPIYFKYAIKSGL